MYNNETRRIYRERNRDKLRISYKLYYRKNREKRLLESREYYRKNRDKILAKNKLRHKTPKARHWAKSARARYRKRNKDYVLCYLDKHPCVDCGEKDIRCLDFDHVNGDKYKEVSYLVGASSINRVVAEIDKCQVRCSNCHRKRHRKPIRLLTEHPLQVYHTITE